LSVCGREESSRTKGDFFFERGTNGRLFGFMFALVALVAWSVGSVLVWDWFGLRRAGSEDV
jgi:hypothetical protein